MNKYLSKFSEISSLETFDAQAFLANEQVSQDVCNFVLTLACIYNDYKDTILALDYLSKVQPPFPVEETATWGEYNGIKFHVIRSQIALVHELLKLIENNKKALEDTFYQSVVNQLDKRGRQSWRTLVAASQGMKDSNKTAKILLMIRNKISFHYDPKEIFKGYKKLFLDQPIRKRTYISRGNTLKEERYYFAEAGAQRYFYTFYEDIGEEKFIKQMQNVINSVAPALSQIIKHFIQKRGYGWKNV